MEEGAPTAQHQTLSTETFVKSAAPARLVCSSPQMRQIIEELVNFTRPITGERFYARYGTHVSLAKIALIPSVRVEHSRDGPFSFSLLENPRACYAGHQLWPQLALLVEDLMRRRQEHSQWGQQTEWVTRVTELIRHYE